MITALPDSVFGVVDTGDTAWVLVSAALVLLMTPALAFFYGGMLRSKTVLNMLMMVMGALFIVGVLCFTYLAFYAVASRRALRTQGIDLDQLAAEGGH